MKKILKTTLIAGGVTIGIGAIAYGIYKLWQVITDEDFLDGLDDLDDYDFDDCCGCGCDKA